jgi:hypothetical protein
MIPYQKQAKMIGKLSAELQQEIHMYISSLLYTNDVMTLNSAAEQVCKMYGFELPVNTVTSWFYRRNGDAGGRNEKVRYDLKSCRWRANAGYGDSLRLASKRTQPSALAIEELGLYKHPDIASTDVIQVKSPRIDEAFDGETIDVTKGGNNLAFLDIKAGDVEIRIQFNVS